MEDLIVRAGVKVLGIHPTGGEHAPDSLKRLVEMTKDTTFQKRLS